MQQEEATPVYLVTHFDRGNQRHWEASSHEALHERIDAELPEDHPVRRLWAQLRPGGLIILNPEEQITYSFTSIDEQPLSDRETLGLVRAYARHLDIYLACRSTLRQFLESVSSDAHLEIKDVWAGFLKEMPSPNQVKHGHPLFEMLRQDNIPAHEIREIFAADQKFLWGLGDTSCLLHSRNDFDAETKILLRLRALILWIQVFYREILDGHELATSTCHWLKPLPAGEQRQAQLALAAGPIWEAQKKIREIALRNLGAYRAKGISNADWVTATAVGSYTALQFRHSEQWDDFRNSTIIIRGWNR